MHPRAIAGAPPHQRVLPLAHQLHLVVDGVRPVERAVAQDRAAGPEDHVLTWRSASSPRGPPSPRAGPAGPPRSYPSALADSVPAGVALRDDMGDAGRLGRGQQVVRPLGAQPVGGREPAVRMLDIGLASVRHGNRGHLVHDHLRPGSRHRLTDRRRVQPVHHDRLGAQLLQQAAWPRSSSSPSPGVPGPRVRHQPPRQVPLPPTTNTRMTSVSCSRTCPRYPRRGSPAIGEAVRNTSQRHATLERRGRSQPRRRATRTTTRAARSGAPHVSGVAVAPGFDAAGTGANGRAGGSVSGRAGLCCRGRRRCRGGCGRLRCSCRCRRCRCWCASGRGSGRGCSMPRLLSSPYSASATLAISCRDGSGPSASARRRSKARL